MTGVGDDNIGISTEFGDILFQITVTEIAYPAARVGGGGGVHQRRLAPSLEMHSDPLPSGDPILNDDYFEKMVLKAAVARTSDRLHNPDCAGLFLDPESNTPEVRRALGRKFENLWNGDSNSSKIRTINPSNMPPETSGVVAFTTGTLGLIYVVSGGGFFTGIQNGKAISTIDPWVGMNLSQIQELVLIHEFMHYMGIVGPDRDPLEYTLPNGQRVKGSSGISKIVREKCFR